MQPLYPQDEGTKEQEESRVSQLLQMVEADPLLRESGLPDGFYLKVRV